MIIEHGSYGPPIFRVDDCYADDPFLGDCDYPCVFQTIPSETGTRLTVVIISQIGDAFFVWVVEKRRFETMVVVKRERG